MTAQLEYQQIQSVVHLRVRACMHVRAYSVCMRVSVHTMCANVWAMVRVCTRARAKHARARMHRTWCGTFQSVIRTTTPTRTWSASSLISSSVTFERVGGAISQPRRDASNTTRRRADEGRTTTSMKRNIAISIAPVKLSHQSSEFRSANNEESPMDEEEHRKCDENTDGEVSCGSPVRSHFTKPGPHTPTPTSHPPTHSQLGPLG
jgi:hypothetical protein